MAGRISGLPPAARTWTCYWDESSASFPPASQPPSAPSCGRAGKSFRACSRHSRAYLHHLFRADEMLGPMLLTWHNLTYYHDLMAGLRLAILDGGLAAHAAAVRAGWTAQEQPA